MRQRPVHGYVKAIHGARIQSYPTGDRTGNASVNFPRRRSRHNFSGVAGDLEWRSIVFAMFRYSVFSSFPSVLFFCPGGRWMSWTRRRRVSHAFSGIRCPDARFSARGGSSITTWFANPFSYFFTDNYYITGMVLREHPTPCLCRCISFSVCIQGGDDADDLGWECLYELPQDAAVYRVVFHLEVSRRQA